MLDKNEFLKIAKNIKLLILDLDGVLTDGTMYTTSEDVEIRGFNAQDTLGLKLLCATELPIAIITGRNSQIVYHHARLIGIDLLYQGKLNKIPAYEDLLKKLKISDQEVAYIGDDITDLPLIRRSGLGIAVVNAMTSVKEAANFITQKSGGCGAVREICDLIMEAQNTLAKAYRIYDLC